MYYDDAICKIEDLEDEIEELKKRLNETEEIREALEFIAEKIGRPLRLFSIDYVLEYFEYL